MSATLSPVSRRPSLLPSPYPSSFVSSPYPTFAVRPIQQPPRPKTAADHFGDNVRGSIIGVTAITVVTLLVAIAIIVFQILEWKNQGTNPSPTPSQELIPFLDDATTSCLILSGYRGHDDLGYNNDVRLVMTSSEGARETITTKAGAYFKFSHGFKSGEKYNLRINASGSPCIFLNQSGTFTDHNISNVIIECPPHAAPTCPRFFPEIKFNSASPTGDGTLFLIDLYFGNISHQISYWILATDEKLTSLGSIAQIYNVIVGNPDSTYVERSNPHPDLPDYLQTGVHQIVSNNRYIHFAWDDCNQIRTLINISNLDTQPPAGLVAPTITSIQPKTPAVCGRFEAKGTLITASPQTYTIELFDDFTAIIPVASGTPANDGTWAITFDARDITSQRHYYARSKINSRDSVKSNVIDV